MVNKGYYFKEHPPCRIYSCAKCPFLKEGKFCTYSHYIKDKRKFTSEIVPVTDDDGEYTDVFFFVCDENETRVIQTQTLEDAEEVVKYINERWFK